MPPQRVLIVSSNELFGQGLQRLLAPLPNVEVVGIAPDMERAASMAVSTRPSVVVVDDGGDPQRWRACLERFFQEQQEVKRIVLLTLGEQGQYAVVYHRYKCSAESVETWLFGGVSA